MSDKNIYCLSEAYEALGIQRGADEPTLKKAYRDSAKRYHTDVNPDDPKAETRFKKTQWAYNLLKEGLKSNSIDDSRRAIMHGGFAMSEETHPFFRFYEALKRHGGLKSSS